MHAQLDPGETHIEHASPHKQTEVVIHSAALLAASQRLATLKNGFLSTHWRITQVHSVALHQHKLRNTINSTDVHNEQVWRDVIQAAHA
jgi:hypothetical protein